LAVEEEGRARREQVKMSAEARYSLERASTEQPQQLAVEEEGRARREQASHSACMCSHKARREQAAKKLEADAARLRQEQVMGVDG